MKWQTYQNLELITGSVLEPQASKSVLVQQLDGVWQWQTNRLLQKLPLEQQTQHLEKCIELADIPAGKSSIWRSIWIFLNQPIFELSDWSTQEPKVRQVSDQGGQVWWYVYDPQTQESIYLETETEVMIWLEEHLSR